jgi:hypothetical protein
MRTDSRDPEAFAALDTDNVIAFNAREESIRDLGIRLKTALLTGETSKISNLGDDLDHRFSQGSQDLTMIR